MADLTLAQNEATPNPESALSKPMKGVASTVLLQTALEARKSLEEKSTKYYPVAEGLTLYRNYISETSEALGLGSLDKNVTHLQVRDRARALQKLFKDNNILFNPILELLPDGLQLRGNIDKIDKVEVIDPKDLNPSLGLKVALNGPKMTRYYVSPIDDSADPFNIESFTIDGKYTARGLTDSLLFADSGEWISMISSNSPSDPRLSGISKEFVKRNEDGNWLLLAGLKEDLVGRTDSIIISPSSPSRFHSLPFVLLSEAYSDLNSLEPAIPQDAVHYLGTMLRATNVNYQLSQFVTQGALQKLTKSPTQLGLAVKEVSIKDKVAWNRPTWELIVNMLAANEKSQGMAEELKDALVSEFKTHLTPYIAGLNDLRK